MSKLYIMMGIPGSGKSTWCEENISNKDNYVSRDRVRFGLLKAGDSYFSKENEVYKEFVNIINRKLMTNKEVYVDQTSLDSRARRKLLNSLQVKPDEVHVIWLKTPLQKSLLYNAKRKGLERVPDHSIIQMHSRLERPTWSEGIKYLHIIENGKETVIDLEAEANKEWIL